MQSLASSYYWFRLVKWMHYNNPQLKQQTSQRKTGSSLLLKKVKAVPSVGKHIMILFLNCEGFVYQYFIKHGHNVTEVYCVVVTHFSRKWTHKCVEEILLHHNNARTVAVVVIKLTRNIRLAH